MNKLPLIFTLCLTGFASTGYSQDCYDSPNLMTATKKEFIVHENGTVTHWPTNLMWKQCLEGLTGDCTEGDKLDVNWEEALQKVEEHNVAGFAGYSDWRLPNPKEVMSIIELGCSKPSINLAVFPNMPGTRIWLSNAAENVASGLNLKSWFANYGQADVGTESGAIDYSNADRLSQMYSVHLVRGAQQLLEFKSAASDLAQS